MGYETEDNQLMDAMPVEPQIQVRFGAERLAMRSHW